MRKLIQSAVVMGALLYAFAAKDSETRKKLNGRRSGKKGKEKRN